MKLKKWTKKEERTLRRLWGNSPRRDIENAFPDRTWYAIKSKACELGLRRAKHIMNADIEQLREMVKFYRDKVRLLEREKTRTEIIIDRLKSVISASEPVPLKIPKMSRKEYDEEEAVLQLSDHQIGLENLEEETGFPSYNLKIYKERLDFLRDTVLMIVDIHRRAKPVRVLNIFSCGD